MYSDEQIALCRYRLEEAAEFYKTVSDYLKTKI